MTLIKLNKIRNMSKPVMSLFICILNPLLYPNNPVNPIIACRHNISQFCASVHFQSLVSNNGHRCSILA